MKTAIVLGVGPLQGLGAQLCLRFAKTHRVLVAGRSQDRLDATVAAIEAAGGEAVASVTDATSEQQVGELVQAAGAELDLAIYNAGNNMPGRIADMSAAYFEDAWRVVCLGGFLFGRDAIKAFQQSGGGTLLFTGASASLRGRPGFGAFASPKAGLRTLAQAMAKEYADEDIHVGHVIVDGSINGEKIHSRVPEYAAKLGKHGMISLHGLVDAYEFLYRQPKTAWTFELDVRTSKESW